MDNKKYKELKSRLWYALRVARGLSCELRGMAEKAYGEAESAFYDAVAVKEKAEADGEDEDKVLDLDEEAFRLGGIRDDWDNEEDILEDIEKGLKEMMENVEDE